ncbi:MAG: acetyl-CoA hydrolase/transferase C-terminal domain-containing protein [Xanthobacteraceae bacterium]
MTRELPVHEIDFSVLLRDGDRVTWGQAAAEPTSLTEALLAQRARLPAISAFVGMSWGTPLDGAADSPIRFLSYCGAGKNRALDQLGRLTILPSSYLELPTVLAGRIDVLMLNLADDGQGRFSFGAAHEYLPALVDGARLVIAEVNEQTPWTHGERVLGRDDIDIVVRTSRPLAAPPPAKPGEADYAIARHVAGLVEDGATLQIGVGALPETILSALSGHRDLGLHTGLVTDGVVDLIEAGVLTNARKTLDPGISIAGFVAGGRRLLDHLHDNRSFCFRQTAYTHGPSVLDRLDRFTSINAALEVDLTGQINAEVAGGRYVGAVGGAGDFLRGAQRSRGGVPIVALPATVVSRSGVASRIVASLSGPVSTPRSDVGFIVTEYGIADLRGQTLPERRRRMIAIAAPQFREGLERAATVDMPAQAPAWMIERASG